MNTKITKINIKGVVQSVGFRPFVKKLADKLGYSGYIRNLADAGVEIILHADKTKAKFFFNNICTYKPELSIILEYHITENIDIIERHEKDKFSIINSATISSNNGISPLPPDIAICVECQTDSSTKRRLDYSFISCTNCGPRFTVIKKIPYDRVNTSFNKFPLCIACQQEYYDTSDRRFHAQTTCCKKCGPEYSVFRWNNKWTESKLNWNDIITKIDKGELWGVMGTGGTHLITNAFNIKAIKNLRIKIRNNNNKPFAVMMRDIETIRKYCFLTEEDEKLLLSSRRPIVIVPLIDPSNWQIISPNLSSIGVMLPYNNFHFILFKYATTDAFLMTSANLPGIPMPITANDVKKQLSQIVDGILVHNKEIIQRVDDSVIRSHRKNHLIIRRSRGFVPQPTYHKDLTNLTAIGLGAQEDNTAAILHDGWIVQTQHLGNVNNLEAHDFLISSINHLKSLYSIETDNYISDIHPTFLTSKIADKLSKNKPSTKVQHHVAHVASLGLDNSIPHEEPLLAWACDGFGLSDDNQAWGTELILIEDGNWKRMASTTPVEYSGNDKNALYPSRMLLKYLKQTEIPITPKIKNQIVKNLAGMNVEYNYIINNKDYSLQTTSIARLLDSIASLLNISQYRSYRGEPAIVLENLAMKSDYTEKINYEDFISYKDFTRIDTSNIFRKIYLEFSNGLNKIDLAKLTHDIIGQTLSYLGNEIAESLGVNRLGFTGGVAYNYLITKNMRINLSKNIELLLHNSIPPGDAGISVGQLNYFGMINK